ALLFIKNQFRKSQTYMGRMQRGEALEQIVAHDNELKRKLRMHFLVAHRHVLNRRDDRLKLFFGLFELLVRFYDLLERCDLFFWLSRLLESVDQVGRFAREEVLWCQRRDVLRRVLGLHRVRFFACKINYDLVEQQVPFAHATESPAFMQTKCARL